MSVWDQAQKLESASGSVWDQAAALTDPNITEESPDEAFGKGVQVQEMSEELEMDFGTIEDNYDNLLQMETTADPSDLSALQDYDPEPEEKPGKVVDEELKKKREKFLLEDQATIRDYLAAGMEYRPVTVADPSDFQSPEPEPVTQKQKIASLSSADFNYMWRVVKSDEDAFSGIVDILNTEREIRKHVDRIKSMPDAEQAAMIASLNFTNLFNAPQFLSRKGLDPIEFFTDKQGDLDAAIQASVRVLAEKNELDPINIARLANISASIGRLVLEFWMTPGASLAKVPAKIRPVLQTGTKFALHEAVQAPREGESVLQRAGSIVESGTIGIVVGGAGKAIPNPFIRVPALVGGLGSLTYARTGDLEAAIETGVTVLGFEALGLMQRAGRAVKAGVRNSFANKAIAEARKHNSGFKDYSDTQVREMLQKQVENWDQATKGRVLSHKKARDEAKRAFNLKKQGDRTAWDAMMAGRGFGQANKDVKLPALPAGKSAKTPVKAPVAPVKAKAPLAPVVEGGKPIGAKVAATKPQTLKEKAAASKAARERGEITEGQRIDLQIQLGQLHKDKAKATQAVRAAKFYPEQLGPAETALKAINEKIEAINKSLSQPTPAVEAPPEQIAEVAKDLPEAQIAEPITAVGPVTVKGKKFHPVTLPTEKINVDPKTFQFKLGAKLAGGVTEALKDVEAFDPVKAGQVLVWQNKAGDYFVVDGHHRVALAKKTGAESLSTWVLREAEGITSADARAIGALRNLADGKGTAIDAAKLFRDSNISIEELKKQGVPTNNAIVKQGMDMKNLSDHVFRLVVNEKLPPSFAAPIGRLVKNDAQQKQVADLILEGEIDTVRQAELLAATIDTAPVLTTSEQTLFGLETTEKSLFAERAKVLANVEKKLKTNKKVFGMLATQTGIIEAKGNVLAKIENLATAERASEILFMLEKLANSKGPVAEALNNATKEYGKNPTKETLNKVTTELLKSWTEGPGRLGIQGSSAVPKLPLERVEPKAVEKPKPKETDLFKPRDGGFVDVTPLAKVHDAFMGLIEPSKAVEIAQGKDVYAEVIKAIHKPEVAMIDFNEEVLANMDRTLSEWGDALAKYPKRILELLMLSRGKPDSKEGIAIQEKALEDLAKEAPELLGTRKMISRIAEFNYDYLKEVVGDEVGYIEDYFYGVYKDPRLVEKFLNHWKTTKRFTKQKKLPTVADAKAFGLELRHINPVDNLRSEYAAIARLDGMIGLKATLMATGEGKYIDKNDVAPIEWDKVQDPVFADVLVAPELAKMINNLIATNKITRQPMLNALRQVNNFLRTLKFVGSAFHLIVEAKQSVAASGYLGFLHKKTALRGFTKGFELSDPIFQTPEYKDYIQHGGGHRFSLASEAQQQFSQMVEKINDKLSGTGKAIKAAAFVGMLPEKFVKWMFESYIPKLKYSKYSDSLREEEVKLGRSLKSAEKIDIIKEQQNFYGMMNERLFGRSGTMTTILRLKFMAPGFAEGNFRTILKSILQWGGDSGFKAHASRANIVNSLLISAIVATVGTLILTGKPPEKPETLKDVRDLFKIDSGKKDSQGRKIMIDMLTYDKDYWDVFGNLVTGQPGAAIETTIRRLGGMTATTWDVISDLNQMSMGKAIYDWKGDRVVEVTDTFTQKMLKLSIHELKKAEPISTNVFQQARRKGVGTALSALMTLSGTRMTTSEKDKRETAILQQIWALRDQQEALFWYLGTIKNPRESIKKYNQTVMRILNNPITTLEMKDEYEPKLIIDVDRLTSNKVYSHEGDRAKLSELAQSPSVEKHTKEIKELEDDVKKSDKWLTNFGIKQSDHKKELVTYEKLHRKLIKEIQPEDNQEKLAHDLAKFYADQTSLRRKIQSGLGTDGDKRQIMKFGAIADNISKVAKRIYKTDDLDTRESLFDRIETVLQRI